MDYKQAFLSQLENSYLGVQIQDAKDLFSQRFTIKGSPQKEWLYQFIANEIKIFWAY